MARLRSRPRSQPTKHLVEIEQFYKNKTGEDAAVIRELCAVLRRMRLADGKEYHRMLDRILGPLKK